MRPLRHRVLEDDHRADDLLPLDVRDVEALDANRQRLEVERLAQFLERLDASRAPRLGDKRLGVERELRVLLRELLQPPLLAALGGPHPPGAKTSRGRGGGGRSCAPAPPTRRFSPRSGARTSTRDPRRSVRNPSSAAVSPAPRGTTICCGIDGATP